MLWAVFCAAGLGQDDSTEKPQAFEIPGLIQDLASPQFSTRREADSRLRKAGDAAIDLLREASKEAPADQKLLIDSILKELEQNSFSVKIRELRKKPLAAAADGLPEWGRFSELVGRDEGSVRIYTRLATAEAKLFSAAAKSSADLPRLIQSRATALLDATVPAPVVLEDWNLDSYAALLLLAGNGKTRLPGSTSTAISSMLNHEEFENAVTKPDGQWLLRLVGSYIQRGRIAVIGPLEFCRRHKMPEGLTLARTVVKTALRGRNGIPAMMVIMEMGSKEDLPLLEATFANRRPLFVTPPDTPPQKRFSVTNGDLALAVAISLHGEDPRDFGFPKIDVPSQPFRFSMETTGFPDNETRQEAIRRYTEKFSRE